jgi:hypothetical protein
VVHRTWERKPPNAHQRHRKNANRTANKKALQQALHHATSKAPPAAPKPASHALGATPTACSMASLARARPQKPSSWGIGSPLPRRVATASAVIGASSMSHSTVSQLSVRTPGATRRQHQIPGPIGGRIKRDAAIGASTQVPKKCRNHY